MSSLNIWVNTQRSMKRKGKLSQDKIDLLEDINLIWDRKERQWNDNYQQLREFYLKEGHSSYPINHVFLGRWSRFQRRQYKQGKLSKERIELLEKIKFKWKYID